MSVLEIAVAISDRCSVRRLFSSAWILLVTMTVQNKKCKVASYCKAKEHEPCTTSKFGYEDFATLSKQYWGLWKFAQHENESLFERKPQNHSQIILKRTSALIICSTRSNSWQNGYERYFSISEGLQLPVGSVGQCSMLNREEGKSSVDIAFRSL